MTALIKSTTLSGEPVVLDRAKKPDATSAIVELAEVMRPAASEPETIAELPLREIASPAVDVQALREEIEASMAQSYEAYKERFHEELQQLAAQAETEGFEKGLAEGKEEAAREYQARIDELAKLIASARAALDGDIDGIADAGIEVICEAVTKIVGEAVVHKDAIISSVREVIRRAKERSKLVVRISSADWEVLENHQAELIEGLHVGSVEIVADDRVQVGGCLLETPAGNLDGRLEVQLERLREILRSARSAGEDHAV